MENESNFKKSSGAIIATIEMRLPSLNEYINVCRTNKYKAAIFKKKLERDISVFLCRLPKFEKPVKIHFHWVEENGRRDYDNICAAKKFILDTLVKLGKLKNDNRKNVYAFYDTFAYEKKSKVVLYIYEKEENEEDGE